MKNYYFTGEDAAGEYADENGKRLAIKEVAPARVHIPDFRKGELTQYDSRAAFIDARRAKGRPLHSHGKDKAHAAPGRDK